MPWLQRRWNFSEYGDHRHVLLGGGLEGLRGKLALPKIN